MQDRAAAVRQQLAAARIKCEYPGCDDQATGVLKLGKTMPYLCDAHQGDGESRTVAERTFADAEHRARYPNGLTYAEWLFLKEE